MKVLFLDVDGVLNSTRTAVAFGAYPMRLDQIGAFDHVAIRLLQRLCDVGAVQIVYSSAWRNDPNWRDAAAAFGLPIVDRTPSLPGNRGTEIAKWLADHPEVECYAIVDDDADMLAEQLPYFVKTDPHEGLSWASFGKLCELFGVRPFDGQPRNRNWMHGGQKLDWSGA